MMKPTKIEVLRKKYTTENISLVDVVRLFDPTKTGVLTKLMTEELIANIRTTQRRYELSNHVINQLHLESKEALEIIERNPMLCSMVEQTVGLLGEDTLYYAKQFKKYWDENKIDHDIYKYKTLDDIKNAVHILDIKEYTKSDSIRVFKVYEDDEWLLILPLSLRASQIYGAGTKWCTTTRDREHYYFEHTYNGLLVYIINKKENRKYAYQKLTEVPNDAGSRMSQFYTAADACIDSIDLDIPESILTVLKNFIKTSAHPRNCNYPDYLTKEYIEFCEREGKCRDTEPQPIDDRPEQPAERPADTPVDAPVRGNISDIMEPQIDEDMPIKMNLPPQLIVLQGRIVAN